MSLDYGFEKMTDDDITNFGCATMKFLGLEYKDYSEANDFARGVLHNQLPWKMFAVSISKVNDKTIPELLWRLHYLERMDGFGAFTYKDITYIPSAAVMSGVKMTTNISNLTRAQWVSKMTKRIDKTLEDKVYKGMREVENSPRPLMAV